MRVLVEGESRGELYEYLENDEFFEVMIKPIIEEDNKEDLEIERFELPRAEALKLMSEAGEDYKVELIKEFEDKLSVQAIKDVDGLVKKTIVDLMNITCEDTKEFMYDLAKYNLSEAYANRLMKINILEMSGTTTRLEYLTHVE